MTKTVYKLFALQTALIDKTLTKADATVLCVLIEYSNDFYGSTAWPSLETLAEVSGLTQRAVQNSIRRLEDGGYISIRRGGGAYLSNRYNVAFPNEGHAPLEKRILAAARKAAEKRENRSSKFMEPSDIGKTENARSKTENNRSKTENARSPDTYLPEPAYLIPSSYEASPGSDAMIDREFPKEEDPAVHHIGNHHTGGEKGAARQAGSGNTTGARLARFERALKAGAYGNSELDDWREELEVLFYSLQLGDPNQGRAGRLIEDIAWVQGYEGEGDRRLADVGGEGGQ